MEVGMSKIDLINGDNMDFMRGCSDNQFDLAIVDPPYGIDVANMNIGAGKGKRCSKIENRKWSKSDWDSSVPSKDYFSELMRISERQIIWGGNYFELPISRHFAVWDKGEGMRGRSFAEGEYAWVSSGGTRIHKLSPVDKHRIHPTQKPVKLYKWLLTKYAKEGDTILDTHGGSMSSVIACIDMQFDMVCLELDKDYFNDAVTRIETHVGQQDMFIPVPDITITTKESAKKKSQ